MTEAVPRSIVSMTPLPANEAERLEALHRYQILDTSPEAAFDRITALAARLFKVPTVLISLVDESRAWFKSYYGFNRQSEPRDTSICNYALLYDEILVIPDTQQDDRFACYPAVQGEPYVRFYASAPLKNRDGFNLGSLCLIDTQPHDSFTDEQQETLIDLAAIVVDELELRSAVKIQIEGEREPQNIEEIRIEEARCLQIYADIVRNIQVGVVVWQLEKPDDPGSFRLLLANSAASATTGCDFESMIGKTMAERFPHLLQTSLVQQYLEVVRTGQSLDLGEVSYSEDGISRGVYSLKAFSLPDRCLGLVFENITARKQIEKQLRDSQRYNRQIAEAMPGILFVHDLIQQQNVYTNRQITDLLGYTSEQVQAMGANAITTLVHPDDLPRVIAYFDTFCSTRNDVMLGIEYRAHHANGEWCWLYTQSVVFQWTEEGLPCQLLGVSIDISDRKRTEQTLAEQEQRYRYIFETVNVAIWEEDFSAVKSEIDRLKAIGIQDFHQYFNKHPEFVQQMALQVRIQNVNQAALQMFGAREKAELLSSLDRIFVSETQEAFTKELLAIAHGEPLFAAETVLQTLQGDQLNVWVTITFPSASERYDHVLVSLTDISDRKQVEQELEQLLAREQVAREQAETANRVKDEFLAVLSHELRSPLNPILGWTKLLQTGRIDAHKTKQALSIIERNAKLQTQLINDLLDISRILQGKLALSEAPVDLGFTLESSLEAVRLAAEAKNIQIQTSVDSSLPPVLGDAGRLQQVVVNLLSNAIKFTPAGGRVEVCLEKVREYYAQMKVTDTGKGITPEFLPYVFESFRQEDGKITRKFGGLGLGLAIVRQLTELHGGTVQAESPGEGAGATFTICLPLMSSHDLDAEDTLQPDQDLNPEPILQGMRILVVDDEADMRDLVVTILGQAGATVQVATSAIEALTIFKQFQPTLIISDIGMPDMDGYTLMRQLKTLILEQDRPIPALALTAYASEFDQQLALQAGFQKHISKPVEPEVLVKTVINLMKSVANYG